MFKCNECNKEYEGGVFCPECGKKLIDVAIIKCPKCDGIIDHLQNYCGICGFGLNSNTDSKTIKNQIPTNKHLTKKILKAFKYASISFIVLIALAIIIPNIMVDTPTCSVEEDAYILKNEMLEYFSDPNHPINNFKISMIDYSPKNPVDLVTDEYGILIGFNVYDKFCECDKGKYYEYNFDYNAGTWR
jgi:hypothetical protein